MYLKNFQIPKITVIFSLLVVISLISSVYAISSLQEASAYTKADTDCGSGKTLVFRVNSNRFACVSIERAQTWVDAGVAKLVDDVFVDPRTSCGGGSVRMIDPTTGNAICSNQIDVQKRINSGWLRADEFEVEHVPTGSLCKTGFVTMDNPFTGAQICVKRADVLKAQALGWEAQDYTPERTITRGQDPSQDCKGGHVLIENVNTGAIVCKKQDEYQKFVGGVWELISEIPDYNVDTPMCSKGQVAMVNTETDDETCVRQDRITTAEGNGYVLLDQYSIYSGAKRGSTDCKGGMIKLINPNTDDQICRNQNAVQKYTNLGWDAIDFIPETTITYGKDTSVFCKGGHVVLMNPNTDAIICAKQQVEAPRFMNQGWVPVTASKSASGTVTSIQDPGIGHESHQLAVVLAPTDRIYRGEITYAASEPIQVVVLHGPLGPNDDHGQPTWSTDGKTKYAMTLITADDSGTYEFAGNALALHTMNTSPFKATYSVTFSELSTNDITVHRDTIHSIPEQALGHQGHSVAFMLPPRNFIYQGGVMSFSASEPVQLATLHGPLSRDQEIGQVYTWDPGRSESSWAVGIVAKEGMTYGTFEFAGNALAAHTTNDKGFTITYTVVTKN